MTFTQARETLGNRSSKKVANNTYLIDLGGYIGLRLHGTIILSFHPDRTEVYTGGWRTVTTKARINEYLPAFRIYQKAGVWYWADGGDTQFQEGDFVSFAAPYTLGYVYRKKD